MIRIDLTHARARFLFLTAMIWLAGFFVFIAVKAWVASRWDSSPNPALWLRAAKLEPDNALYWQHAGLNEQWDLTNGDPQKAIVYLRRATEIDPRYDKLWMELASAYENVGDGVSARQAYVKAKQVHPISADVAWRYGSFLLREGDLQSGFIEIRRALLNDPSLTANAISECWKANPDVNAILNTALPAGEDYYVVAINFLLGKRQLDAALAVWSKLMTFSVHIKMAQAIPLVDALIDYDRVADAERVWRHALKLTNWPEERTEHNSVIFNGGFENKPADGGFDWREQSTSSVSFALDTSVFHSGRQSMRVRFDGSTNVNFMHLLQYVHVGPGQRYHFSAYLRTEAIGTDSGVRFLIYDPIHPTKIQIVTANMVGTNPWTAVNVDVTTPADTDLLVIALRRIPSWKFDNKLRGTAWVDDVTLVHLKELPLDDSR